MVLGERTRHSVYWEENTTRVRRCSWFFKPDGEVRYVPYEEHIAEKLEVFLALIKSECTSIFSRILRKSYKRRGHI